MKTGHILFGLGVLLLGASLILNIARLVESLAAVGLENLLGLFGGLLAMIGVLLMMGDTRLEIPVGEIRKVIDEAEKKEGDEG